MWFSAKGIQSSRFKFPYEARTSTGLKTFKDMDDVHAEILAVVLEAEQKGFNIGEAIYYDHLFWANSTDLVDTDSQVFIKSYLYCQESNTPPYKSLYDTPADFIDSWMIVRSELDIIKNLQLKEAQKKNG